MNLPPESVVHHNQENEIYEMLIEAMLRLY